ncbi:MAG: hypothetical protein ABIW47_09690 [Ginsengibacter sp.]|jgi:hypothetical protein
MKYLLTICLFILFSCNSGNNNANQKLPDPLKENPEADAIPEDMKIKNDSVVVPDKSVVDTIRMSDTSGMNQK